MPSDTGPAAPFRLERDSMGEVRVPADALWGAQTQRALDNFRIGGPPMPPAFVHALGLVKWAAAHANAALGELEPAIAQAIEAAALEGAAGRHDAQFPVEVFQTGSGTSTNMNVNEVIARLASRAAGRPIHPNDHVNCGQSSNDCIPTALHVGAALLCTQTLLPALAHLRATLDAKSAEVGHVVKTGRTHLMDAMPVTFAQELGAWRSQVDDGRARVEAALVRIRRLAQGATAVGTGVNAHPRFAAEFARVLSRRTGIAFEPSPNPFAALSSQDAAVELSGAAKVLAVSLLKIANDLRWMNSGPLAGLGEIALPALQPGSSIMPGKVNPVIPEAVAMVGAQVIGNDAAITVAGQSGNFQLNVMLPLIAHDLFQSLALLANASRALADRAIAGFTVNESRIAAALDRNPILVTALNPVIGYDRSAAIAKRAYAEGRAVREVAREDSGLPEAELAKLLDPAALTRGGVKAGGGGG
ncbi:MAG: class II fumarate hydratase [Pseudomonadota bacterium]